MRFRGGCKAVAGMRARVQSGGMPPSTFQTITPSACRVLRHVGLQHSSHRRRRCSLSRWLADPPNTKPAFRQMHVAAAPPRPSYFHARVNSGCSGSFGRRTIVASTAHTTPARRLSRGFVVTPSLPACAVTSDSMSAGLPLGSRPNLQYRLSRCRHRGRFNDGTVASSGETAPDGSRAMTESRAS